MLNERSIRELLTRVASGTASVDEAVSALGTMPFEDLSFAKIDHHRDVRRGFPEVIYCAGKTPEQTAAILARLAERSDRVLGTRATHEHFLASREKVADVQFDQVARVLWVDRLADASRRPGVVLLAAGTSDLPVAEEAAHTLRLMGHEPHRLYDVGVAGLHRLLHHLPLLRQANVVIVVAGMEGALPGVVAGLLRAPVIAVPTSVGYGASLGGLAALLGMLNSCSPGVGVVNIDNGYGAAHLAAAINSQVGPAPTGPAPGKSATGPA